MLTKQQQAHFKTFGFLVIRQLLTTDEVDLVTRELEAALLKDRDGKPFDRKKRQHIMNWYEGGPAAYIANDARIHQPIEQLLGPDYIFSEHNDGNYYVGDTGWHPDMGWDPNIPAGRNDPYRVNGPMKDHYVPSIKVGFYLDPVDADTGALRVIPGAHRGPFHEQLWSLHLDVPVTVSAREEVRPKLLAMWERDTGSFEGAEEFFSNAEENHFGIDPRDIPGYAIESQPGDAVFFSHQMWHSSFGGRAGRRMFTFNFRSAPGEEA